MSVSTRVQLGTCILIPAIWVGIASCTSEPATSTSVSRNLDTVLAATPTAAAQIIQTNASTCVNDARFVEDLTIPDRTKASPGEVMDKRWAVLNSGTCDWGAGYRLVRIDEGPIEAPPELALYPARAGETGIWTIQIIAPEQQGDQVASWQAQSPDGTFFGDQVFVLIEVER